MERFKLTEWEKLNKRTSLVMYNRQLGKIAWLSRLCMFAVEELEKSGADDIANEIRGHLIRKKLPPNVKLTGASGHASEDQSRVFERPG